MEILYTPRTIRNLALALATAKAHGYTHVYYCKPLNKYLIFKDVTSAMARHIMKHNQWWAVDENTKDPEGS